MASHDLNTVVLPVWAHHSNNLNCISELHISNMNTRTGAQAGSQADRGAVQDTLQVKPGCVSSILIPFEAAVPRTRPLCYKYSSRKHLQELVSNVLLEF